MPRIPTQEWCLAQEDPKVRHQWAFPQCIPFGPKSLVSPDGDMFQVLSERVEETGYMHVSELAALADEDGNIHVSKLRGQTKKFILPAMGQHHTLNNSGRWADMDEPDTVAMVSQDMDMYTTEQNENHFQQLLEKGFRPPESEEGPGEASVEVPKTFNPSDWTPSEVKGYLLGQDDTERRRVLALEMRHKRRDKILNYPDWKGL
ncbi:DUF2744 domain-containing protein [Rhodococcus sp. NPDC057297]|uniref:phage gene 29 protein family protein n=1 Tax=Rhodococcus sp. NPDC057297 TaxID=3346090 RepID=UPI00362A3500